MYLNADVHSNCEHAATRRDDASFSSTGVLLGGVDKLGNRYLQS